MSRWIAPSKPCASLALVSVLGVALSGLGCAAMPALGMPEISLGSAPQQSAAVKTDPAKAKPSFNEAMSAPNKVAVVFMRPDGSPDGGVVMDSSEDLSVSTVLDKSKAWSKYGKFTVKLDRRLPNGGRHPLDVEVNSYGRKIDPLKDYHVRGGDRLVVTRDDTMPYEDMVNKISPFGTRKEKSRYKVR